MSAASASPSSGELKEDLGDALGAWWLFLIAGIISFGIGFVVPVFFPKAGLLTIGILFGAWMVAWGGLSFYRAFQVGATTGPGVASLFLGLLGVVVGIMTIIRPVSGTLALVLLLGIWWVVSGAFELVHGFTKEGGMWDVVLGLLGFVAGMIIITNPGIGLLTVIWIFGITLMIRGVIEIGLALQMRKAHKELTA